MSTREWFTNLPGSPSIKWAAETSGVDRDTISRQLKHDRHQAMPGSRQIPGRWSS